jgi:hypothetical protein
MPRTREPASIRIEETAEGRFVVITVDDGNDGHLMGDEEDSIEQSKQSAFSHGNSQARPVF